MPDILTIPKKSSFPPYLDFTLLRAAGIKHIEELGSDLWTDYNVHDPGITILEALCFVLTDLGYRTNFDVKDLLTRSTEAKNGEDKTIFKLPFDDNFFTAAEVLSCNPVTIYDLRKLLIDIHGVKNAWFKKAPEGEHPIFLNRKNKKLQLVQAFANDDQKDRVLLRGLYDVYVELDELVVTDACGRTFFSKDNILKEVYEVLHAHRNLCEDIREVLVLGDEQIALCSEIELSPNADPEDVYLEIYKRVEEFLSPTIRFYTLQEMLAKGIPVEEIFAGRPLSPKSHGFIDLEELKKIELRTDLHVSDLYQVIMDIPGIAAIRNLSLTNYIDGVAFTKGEKWGLSLHPLYRQHFDFVRSKITFFKGVLPFYAVKKEVEKRYNEEKAAKKKADLDPYQLDLPIPEGTYRDIEEYTSIMEEFPLTYGIGQAGIKQLPTPLRLGQAKQLKAYLLFFDQLLANYLTQLSHIRDLFSIRAEESPKWQGKKHTYFTHVLSEVPGIEALVKNFKECALNNEDVSPPEDYPSYLQYIAESLETYQGRRNRFLDHLLARFAESFTDYVLLSYKLGGGKIDPSKIIQDKADFLNNYPEISRNRGKGMDYSASQVWNTGNISGLEKRVSKLIGIDNATRRTLSHTRLVETVAGWGAEILGADDKVVMTSKSVWPSNQGACDAVKSWANLIGSEQYYRRLTFDVPGDGNEYGFVLLNTGGTIIAESVNRYLLPAQRDAAIHGLINRTILPGLHCSWAQEVNCFYFELYDFLDAKRLFVSQNGFKSILEAKEFFDAPDTSEDFLGWAVLIDHYDKTGIGDGPFSFNLKDSNGIVQAVHPQVYVTEQERDDRLQAIIYYLDSIPPTFEIEAEKVGDFQFDIVDAAGTILLKSTLHYTTQIEAENAAWKTRLQARHLVYYKPNNTAPYSFTIVDRHGDEIAYHPYGYGTECERDLAIESLLYGSQNIAVKHKVEEQADGYHYVLLNPSGEPLMTSLIGHGDAHAAETAWSIFLDFAEQKDRYHITEEAGAECPFGFELRNGNGQTLAYSNKKYATEAEAKMAIRAIRNYVCHTEWTNLITGEPGIYWFKLLGVNGRLLLRSAISYPDEPSAKFAYQAALLLAMDQTNYVDLPGFGFNLGDENGKIIALHPQYYTNDGERDAAKNLVINYVRTDLPHTQTPNTGGAFYGIILGPDATPIFTGTKIHPNWERAKAEVDQLLLFATDRDNYLAHADSYTTCQFGFYLTDETGTVVAKHTKTYPTIKERDKAMQDVFAWLTHGEALTDDVIQGKPDYRFALKNKAGQRLLIAANQFDTPQDAEKAFRACLENAVLYERYEKFPAGSTGKLGFTLKNNKDQIIAHHETLYETETAREEAIREIILFVSLRGATYRFFEEDETWKYALQNVTGDDVLIDTIGATDKSGAADKLKQTFIWAQKHQRYIPLDDDASCNFSFVLSDVGDAPVATHPDWYGTEDLRNAAIVTFIDYLTNLDIEAEVFEEEGTFYFQLSNFAGNILLKSKKDDYLTKDATKTDWHHLVQAIHDPANFQVIYNNNQCQYSVGILVNGQIIACPPDYFTNRTAVNKWIEELVFLLKRQHAATEISGTTCGYYFVVELMDGNVSTQLLGTRRYPVPADAERACHELAVLLRSENTFKIEEINGKWFLTVYDGNKELVAKSAAPPFETQADAQVVYDAIIEKLSKDLVISCKSVEREHEYRCELSVKIELVEDEKSLLENEKNCKLPHGKYILQRLTGKAFTRFGRSDRTWASRAVRDAMVKEAQAFFKQESPVFTVGTTLDGKYFKYTVDVGNFQIVGDKTYPTEEEALKALNESKAKWLEGVKTEANFQPLDDETHCRFGFEIIDATKKDAACQDCNQLLELAQKKERYRNISNEEECLFGFELTNQSGESIALGLEFFKTLGERDKAINQIIEQVNDEGMHLVEHLLLRPRKKALEPRYGLKIKDQAEQILLQSIDSFASAEDAEKAFWSVMTLILRAKEGETQLIQKVRENPMKPGSTDPNNSCWLIEVLDRISTPNDPQLRVVARSPEGFCAEPSITDILKLVEGIGTIDENNPPKQLQAFAQIQLLPRLYDDLEQDKLFPIIGDCVDPALQLPTDLTDPYSFRATVVLPYWPARFQKSEFRSFIETTLRQEAPAHVFLRICWVDACQMREFEEAYQRWLHSKAKGVLSCDASAALNALTCILFRLKNIYPTGTLHDCSEPDSDANQIVLNYSILGSANSKSHDNQ